MLNAISNKFIFISLNPIGMMANNVGIKNKTISKYKFKLNKMLKSFTTAMARINANPIQEKGTSNTEEESKP